jgi:hypothetical protein
MTSSYSAPVQAGTWPQSAPRSWVCRLRSSKPIPSKAVLRNAEIAYLLRIDANKFGIEGASTMRYDAAFERPRQVAVERVRGLRFLMRKNNIDEYEGEGIFVDRHTIRIKGNDVDTHITFDAAIIAAGANPPTAHRCRMPSSATVRSLGRGYLQVKNSLTPQSVELPSSPVTVPRSVPLDGSKVPTYASFLQCLFRSSNQLMPKSTLSPCPVE